MPTPNRLIVGMSGASGAILGIELLKALQTFPGWESHLVISGGARRTIEHETGLTVKEVEALATRCHPLDDVGASIASGTFKTHGMVVVPCSMKTLAGVATGYSDNLLLRAADVVIKERRKLVLVARESPLSPLHLRNMQTASELGAILLPPVLTFYNHPFTIEDMTRHIVGKILDIFGLEMPRFQRWGEAGASAERCG
ncbi:UbiX family flavin prenyltransferase [Geothrix sp. 21YS21S-4]|uniref:UbiX family flavin prenyltransferase n=1 Tax=Geothrix sp. 21YS21S-4 TaxID=3068889 RepID=UPI0027B9A020|nr:UbiX family flavin prenyltransferase [Geothrix sp. 21YS21S-4]